MTKSKGIGRGGRRPGREEVGKTDVRGRPRPTRRDDRRLI
jgi:hypothetical protein